MTSAASVACGIRPISGASSSMVAAVAAAVTSWAICERAPARRFTAVCDIPPPDGIAPKNAPARLPPPVASSSRLARGSGSSLAQRAADGDRLGETHQGDAACARPHLTDQREVGQGQVREAARHRADEVDASTLPAQQRRTGDRPCHGDQRRRPARTQPFDQDQREDRGCAQRQRWPRRCRRIHAAPRPGCGRRSPSRSSGPSALAAGRR